MSLVDVASKVQQRAVDVHPGRQLLGLLLLAPIAVGWLAGALVRGVAVAFAWVWAAAQEGYELGRSGESDRR